jgi:GT2 family glycosyltransferase
MATPPNISVVIPLFNKRNYIGRALRSVLEQTAPWSEIVVVDDGSTDGGHRVVEDVRDARIRVFRQPNQGCSLARNRGIEEAHGALIAFLDADDEWKPWFLEVILRLHARYPEAGAYATAFEVQHPDGWRYVPPFTEIPPAPWEGIIPNFFRSVVGREGPLQPSAIAVRREVFDVVGGFPSGSGIGEDVDLYARIALRYPIAFSGRAGAVYHHDAENRYCETVFKHAIATGYFQRVLREQGVPSHLRPDVQEFLAHEQLIAASVYIFGGQSQTARGLLRHCQTRRFRRQKLWWWFWSLLPVTWVRFARRGKRWVRRCLHAGRRKLRPCPEPGHPCHRTPCA